MNLTRLAKRALIVALGILLAFLAATAGLPLLYLALAWAGVVGG